MSEFILCYGCEHGKWERVDPDTDEREIACEIGLTTIETQEDSLCPEFTKKIQKRRLLQ